jgi:hypothetical protein
LKLVTNITFASALALAGFGCAALAGCSTDASTSAPGAKGPPAVVAPGYSGKGALVIQTALADAKVSLGGNIAFEQRGQQVRVDVLSLAIPGVDQGVTSALNSVVGSALGTQLFPPGGFSFVYDHSNSNYLVWSPSKRQYYSGSFANKSPNANGGAGRGSGPNPSATPEESNPFAFARELKDFKVLSMGLSLAGRGTTNGHPTTGVNYQLQREDNSGQKTDIHGTIQFADDLDGMPVQLLAAFKGAGAPDSAIRLDLTDLARRDSPAGDFHAPADFTRASSLSDVMGKVPGIPTP